MSLAEFTYEGYAALLERLGQSHRCSTFADATGAIAQDAAFYILRHDIDYSLEAALAMAEFEAELGLRATYFVLFSCPYYNLFEARKGGIVRRIAALGHEIGLHYDLSAFEASGVDPERLLASEAAMLSELAGSPVCSISMHNPGISRGDPFMGTTRFQNAYAPEYTKKLAYYSDSCGAWRDATLAALSAGPLPRQFQLLVHPVFWARTPEHRERILEAVTADARRVLDEESARMRKLWANHAGVIEHERRRAAQTR